MATIQPLVTRRLRRRGLTGDAEDATALDLRQHGAIRHRLARHGRRTLYFDAGQSHRQAPNAVSAASDGGFSLHAALVIPAGQRGRLERLCRYVLR